MIANKANKDTEKFLNLSLSQNKLIPKKAYPIKIGKTLIIVLRTKGNDLAKVFETNEYECAVCKYFNRQNQESMQPIPITKLARDTSK